MSSSTNPYPDEPGAKRTGTSTDAAVSMKKKAPTLRAEVLETIKREGNCTADEMAAHLGESVLSIRPRFSELVEQGLIKDSGLRRQNASGRAAVVWTPVFTSDQATLF